MSSQNQVLDFLVLLVAHKNKLTQEYNRKLLDVDEASVAQTERLEQEVEDLGDKLRDHPLPDAVKYVAEEAGLDPNVVRETAERHGTVGGLSRRNAIYRDKRQDPRYHDALRKTAEEQGLDPEALQAAVAAQRRRRAERKAATKPNGPDPDLDSFGPEVIVPELKDLHSVLPKLKEVDYGEMTRHFCNIHPWIQELDGFTSPDAEPPRTPHQQVTRQDYERLLEIKRKIDSHHTYIGQSIAILKVFEKIQLYNRSTLSDDPVLILGPTGAGKSDIAELIHKQSPRKDKRFHRVQSNMLRGADDGIILAHWSGHGKNATVRGVDTKTGADGILQKYEGGTIFIDEAADLSEYMQGFVLDVLDEKPIRRASGDPDDVKPNVRLLLATNADLASLVEGGKFRHDLLRRICVQAVRIPPLVERKEDIPLLVRKWCQDEKHESRVSNDFYLALFRYDWPGNIGELRQQVRQAIARANGKALSAEHLRLETATDVKRMNRRTVMGELYDILKGKLEAKGFYKGKGGGLHQEIAGILGCSAPKVSEMANVSIGERG